MKLITAVILISLGLLASAQSECSPDLRNKYLTSRTECLSQSSSLPPPTVDVDDDVEEIDVTTPGTQLPEGPVEIIVVDNATDQHSHDHHGNRDPGLRDHTCRHHGRRHNRSGHRQLVKQLKRCLVEKLTTEPTVDTYQADCNLSTTNVPEAFRQFKQDICVLRKLKQLCGINNRRRPASWRRQRNLRVRNRTPFKL